MLLFWGINMSQHTHTPCNHPTVNDRPPQSLAAHVDMCSRAIKCSTSSVSWFTLSCRLCVHHQFAARPRRYEQSRLLVIWRRDKCGKRHGRLPSIIQTGDIWSVCGAWSSKVCASFTNRSDTCSPGEMVEIAGCLKDTGRRSAFGQQCAQEWGLGTIGSDHIQSAQTKDILLSQRMNGLINRAVLFISPWSLHHTAGRANAATQSLRWCASRAKSGSCSKINEPRCHAEAC